MEPPTEWTTPTWIEIKMDAELSSYANDLADDSHAPGAPGPD